MSAETGLYRRAIVRTPGSNFGDGLTTAQLGTPDHERALAQHAAYVAALERCGVSVTCLPVDLDHPDSVFVEDTAILLSECAILTRPGAPSRRGEVSAIRPALARLYRDLSPIEPPGTLDGGDVCEADGHFLIGISERTNEEGALQLAAILARHGRTSALVDVRGIEGILHLKSGIGYLGEGRFAAIPALREHPALGGSVSLTVDPDEAYAANCVRVNDRLLVAAGFPKFRTALRGLGYEPLPLEMSEFERMDGGLSCLSLRF